MDGLALDPYEVMEEASREPPDAYQYRHRCDKCGGFLRNNPDREHPSTWISASSQEFDCRKCGETTSYDY